MDKGTRVRIKDSIIFPGVHGTVVSRMAMGEGLPDSIAVELDGHKMSFPYFSVEDNLEELVSITTMPCFQCGKTSTLELPKEKMDELKKPGGALVQDIFPDMPASQRELLISGIHPECWDKIMSEPDD